MRRAFLLRSVQRAFGADTTVHDAAYMWTRHRWVVPFSAAVLATAVLFTPVVGIEDWPTRLVIGAGITAIAVTAATEYRVLALTDRGLALLRASKIRQVAKDVQEMLPAGVGIEPVGGTVFATDWQVGDRRFTVPRSSEQAMSRIAMAR